MNTTIGMTTARRRGILGWVIFAIVALSIVAGLVFWSTTTATGYMPFGYYRPYFFFPFGIFFFIIFLFFIFRIAFWGGRWGWRSHGYYWSDAREILRQRYARGDITRDQFEQMMRDLEEHK